MMLLICRDTLSCFAFFELRHYYLHYLFSFFIFSDFHFLHFAFSFASFPLPPPAFLMLIYFHALLYF